MDQGTSWPQQVMITEVPLYHSSKAKIASRFNLVTLYSKNFLREGGMVIPQLKPYSWRIFTHQSACIVDCKVLVNSSQLHVYALQKSFLAQPIFPLLNFIPLVDIHMHAHFVFSIILTMSENQMTNTFLLMMSSLDSSPTQQDETDQKTGVKWQRPTHLIYKIQ